LPSASPLRRETQGKDTHVEASVLSFPDVGSTPTASTILSFAVPINDSPDA